MKDSTIEIFARFFTAIGFFAGFYLSYKIMQFVLLPMGFEFNKPIQGQGFSEVIIGLTFLSVAIIFFTSMLSLFFWFVFISKMYHVPKLQIESITSNIVKKDPREKLMLGVYRWMINKIYTS